MQRILIVEDERRISELIEMTLARAGYTCQQAFDGVAAADLIEDNTYDLVLLDIMLPGHNGYDLMEYIKPTGMPVIFLTAKADLRDREHGLNMGADDYIVKPLEPMELVARVETVLRRFGKASGEIAHWGVCLNTQSHTVTKAGAPVELTPREFALLELLMRNPGVALYRDVMYERAWGGEPEDATRTLDLHILRLRKKLSWNERIRTVYKIGYMLEKED